MVPKALQMAIDEDVEFRRGLPREYSSYMGIANSDMVSKQTIQVNQNPLTEYVRNKIHNHMVLGL